MPRRSSSTANISWESTRSRNSARVWCNGFIRDVLRWDLCSQDVYTQVGKKEKTKSSTCPKGMSEVIPLKVKIKFAYFEPSLNVLTFRDADKITVCLYWGPYWFSHTHQFQTAYCNKIVYQLKNYFQLFTDHETILFQPSYVSHQQHLHHQENNFFSFPELTVSISNRVVWKKALFESVNSTVTEHFILCHKYSATKQAGVFKTHLTAVYPRSPHDNHLHPAFKTSLSGLFTMTSNTTLYFFLSPF